MKFLLRWLVTAVAVAAAVWLIPGIETVGSNHITALVLGSLCLALVNAFVRPVLKVLSLPLTILTLGLFTLVLNGLMLELASWLSTNMLGTGIYVSGIWSAIFGSIIISIVSSILNGVISDNKD